MLKETELLGLFLESELKTEFKEYLGKALDLPGLISLMNKTLSISLSDDRALVLFITTAYEMGVNAAYSGKDKDHDCPMSDRWGGRLAYELGFEQGADPETQL